MKPADQAFADLGVFTVDAIRGGMKLLEHLNDGEFAEAYLLVHAQWEPMREDAPAEIILRMEIAEAEFRRRERLAARVGEFSRRHGVGEKLASALLRRMDERRAS